MKIMVTSDEIVNGGLWRLFPVIECNKTKDIPCDYPGAIGVPITALDKIGRNDGHSGFLIIDNAMPKINEKQCYRRLIIRNLEPKISCQVDILEMLEKCGVNVLVEFAVERKAGRNE